MDFFFYVMCCGPRDRHREPLLPPATKLGQGYIYRPQRSWGKVIFSQACVILFTGGGGVCLSACWDTTPPSTAYWEIRSMSGWYASYWNAILVSQACAILFTGGGGLPQCMLGYHPPTRHPPPLGAEHAGRYGQRASGAHPTGMQSCFLLCPSRSLSSSWSRVVCMTHYELIKTGVSI